MFSVKKNFYIFEILSPFKFADIFQCIGIILCLQSVAYPETETLISKKIILSPIRFCGPAELFRMVLMMLMNWSDSPPNFLVQASTIDKFAILHEQ